MSETTDKIEISEHKTRNYVLYGAVAVLLLIVQGFCALVMTNGIAEMRETNRNLTEVTVTQRVQQARIDYVQRDVEDLKSAKKEATAVHTAQAERLNAVEQSVALQNQWIQAHNK